MLEDALRAAISVPHEPVIRLLLPLISAKQSHIDAAIREGSWSTLSLLLSHAKSDVSNRFDSSLLVHAIERGKFVLALKLIRWMKTESQWEHVQRTALPQLLRAAGMRNATSILPVLLDGVDDAKTALTTPDEFGNTVLDLSAALGHVEITSMLIKKLGANAIQGKSGVTTRVVSSMPKIGRLAKIKMLALFLLDESNTTATSPTKEPEPEALHSCENPAIFHNQYT